MPTTTPLRHRRGTTIALLAGPVVTLAGMAATPWEPETSSASYLQTMAAHPTQVQVSATLLVVGYALLGLALFTVLRLAPGVSARLRGPAAVLSFCMATVLPGMVTVDWVHLAIAQQLPLADGVRVMDAAGDGAGGLVSIPAVAGMVLGTLLVVACAWRARLVGVWALVLTVAGLGAAVAGPVGIVAGSAATVAVFAGIAVGARRAAPVEAPEAPAATRIAIAA